MSLISWKNAPMQELTIIQNAYIGQLFNGFKIANWAYVELTKLRMETALYISSNDIGHVKGYTV